jgi:hypothetical protein
LDGVRVTAEIVQNKKLFKIRLSMPDLAIPFTDIQEVLVLMIDGLVAVNVTENTVESRRIFTFEVNSMKIAE